MSLFVFNQILIILRPITSVVKTVQIGSCQCDIFALSDRDVSKSFLLFFSPIHSHLPEGHYCPAQGQEQAQEPRRLEQREDLKKMFLTCVSSLLN